jgi:transposase-like protein
MADGLSQRDPARERFWREQVQGQAASGLSVGAYCRRHRLRPSAFYYWRRALAKGGRPGGEGFVPVTVADETTGPAGAMQRPTDRGQGGRIEILLANGRRVRVTGRVDRQALAAVLAVVEGVPC